MNKYGNKKKRLWEWTTEEAAGNTVCIQLVVAVLVVDRADRYFSNSVYRVYFFDKYEYIPLE